MASVVYDYSEIKESYKAARKAADKMEDYAGKLESGVMKKLNSLTLGSSSNTSNCYDYMSKKVESLNKKSQACRAYADKTDNLLNDSEGIKETDKKVATKIKEMSSIFCKANGYSTNAVYDFFVWASTTILNKTALGRFLKKVVTSFTDMLEAVGDAIKYWYRCDGGKYVVKIAIAVVVVVVAVVLCVLAWPAMVAGLTAILAGTISFAALSAVAAGILAIIAVGDAIVNLVGKSAALAKNGQDPAWAKRCASYTGMADFLKRKRFKSSFANKASMHGSRIIKGVTIVCTVICVADLAIKGVKAGAKIGKLIHKARNPYSSFADGMRFKDKIRYIYRSENKFFNEFAGRAKDAGLSEKEIQGAYKAMQKKDYYKMASYFDVSTPVDKAVFWSGDKEGAAEFAKSIGGSIMEGTPGGKVFDGWKGLAGMYPEWKTGATPQQEIWKGLSKYYAQSARGKVTYCVAEGYNNPESIWRTVESVELLKSRRAGLVTDIVERVIPKVKP